MGNLGYGAFATHPGEVLKDEIEERGISQRQLADSMGLPYSVVNEILNGRRPLTAKTALMFEAALDVPADSLMYMQTKYTMQTARKDSNLLDMLKGIKKVARRVARCKLCNKGHDKYEKQRRRFFRKPFQRFLLISLSKGGI